MEKHAKPLCPAPRGDEYERLIHELVTEHMGALVRVIQPYCSRDDLEDRLHDVLEFILLRLRGGLYRETGSFRQWACRVAHNYMVSECRKKAVVTVSLDDCRGDVAVPGNYRLSARERESKLCALESVLSGLPKESLRLAELKMKQGLTFREISVTELVKVTTLSARFQKICLILRTAMEELGYTDGEL